MKTWRIKNTGTCSWTKDYRIYFLSGNAMNAPASVAFPANVNPGSTVDLSVPMNAPGTTGDYTGNWMLKAANGTTFGVGAGGNVPSDSSHQSRYRYQYRKIRISFMILSRITAMHNGVPMPDSSIAPAMGSTSPTDPSPAVMHLCLKAAPSDDEGALQTVPATGGDGMIQGQYPSMLIHSGDIFAASLFCSNKMTACSVTFELSYMVKGTTTKSVLGTWNKTLTATSCR